MRTVGVLLALAACKGQDRPPPPAPAVGSAAPAEAAATDWTAACEAALEAAPKLSPVRRITAVIDGCRPCGDWRPLLQWRTPAAEGGPSTAAIEDAMLGCKAYCSADAKLQFTAALEAARGGPSQKPWRLLGDACGEAVSAVPDARFLSAPYFALDRIARAAAAVPRLATRLATIELPLPALSLTGAGFELPEAPVMKPEPGAHHVTVSAGEIRIGSLPRARLGATGVVVELGAAPYPGEAVDATQLAGALAKLTGQPDATVTLIAPGGLPAGRVADVIAAAAPMKLVLAADATGAPPGWSLPGVVPVVLATKVDPQATAWRVGADVEALLPELAKVPAGSAHVLEVAEPTTVAGLAQVLGALAYRDIQTVAIVRAPTSAKSSQHRP